MLLAPGVTPTGPSGNIIMSGALSFETQYLVNGVVINENLRGQALNLFIEDAIQETKISTASISAEYGRFGGGVVNMITKSGGNLFSGSFRTTFNNDAWRSLTPDPNDKTVNKVTPVYEATLGGPILQDRLWFFAAYRYTKPEENRTTRFTGYNYTWANAEPRYELKGTYAINSKNKFIGSYTKRTTKTTNNSFGVILDQASLYDNSTDQHLSVLNYTSVLTNNLFLEGQYSRQDLRDDGHRIAVLGPDQGHADQRPVADGRHRQPALQLADLLRGLLDSKGIGWLEHRDNWDWYAKVSYFLSTAEDRFAQLRVRLRQLQGVAEEQQLAVGQRVQHLCHRRSDHRRATCYPVFNNDSTTFVNWMPLVKETVGNDIRTYSAYANDSWRYNNKLSFNLGARFDMNRSKDQSGLEVVKDSQWSPRVGVTYDLKGDGKWTANAAFSRYVAGISTALVDAGSAGGRTASYSYIYKGPNVNTGGGPYLTPADALTIAVGVVRRGRRHEQACRAHRAEHPGREHQGQERREVPQLERVLGRPRRIRSGSGASGASTTSIATRSTSTATSST